KPAPPAFNTVASQNHAYSSRSIWEEGDSAMKIVSLVVAISLITLPAFAQVGSTGQISGRVTDPSSAVLPGVEITATQTETGLVRSVVTNEAGLYSLPNLPIGPYKVEAALPGFRTFVQTAIVLQVNANLVVDAVLQVGEAAPPVEVQAHY